MRLTIFPVFFAGVLGIYGTLAWADPPKLTLREAQALANAIRSLDGHQIVVKDQVVTVPYEFANGTVRAKLGNDLSILKLSETSIELTRQQIVREVMTKHNITEIKPATLPMEDFLKQMNAALDQEAPGTQDLGRIKVEDLHMDKNEIPLSTLAGLKPILEDGAK